MRPLTAFVGISFWNTIELSRLNEDGNKNGSKSPWLFPVVLLLFITIALWNRADHYTFIVWFLSIFFFFLA